MQFVSRNHGRQTQQAHLPRKHCMLPKTVHRHRSCLEVTKLPPRSRCSIAPPSLPPGHRGPRTAPSHPAVPSIPGPCAPHRRRISPNTPRTPVAPERKPLVDPSTGSAPSSWLLQLLHFACHKQARPRSLSSLGLSHQSSSRLRALPLPRALPGVVVQARASVGDPGRARRFGFG